MKLLGDGMDVPVRSVELPQSITKGAVLLEMSLIDRQVLVAVDGQTVLVPWPIPQTQQDVVPTGKPVRFGARGMPVKVNSLKLYRDVYYTRKGIRESYKLGADEYFVLGDNSPISFDSRSWREGAVYSRLFLGKPMLVHLPSRPGTIKMGDRNYYFRIPDFSRMRYIH